MTSFSERGTSHLFLCAQVIWLLGACAGSDMATAVPDGGSTDPTRVVGDGDQCGNGLDDDGDGSIDEGCPCGGGETQSCFSGAVAEREVGSCADGLQRCMVEGSEEFGYWGACEGDVLASEEVCDGVADDDCDGAVDESCPCTEGASQSCGLEFLAEPCSGGIQTCRSGSWSDCEGAVVPETEVCNDDIDNDCDGDADEGCGCEPSPEVCDDDIDNDCDGEVDETACGTTGCLEPPCDTPTPTCTERRTGIVDLGGVGMPFCARHQDGRVFCWGSNFTGALGVGDPELEDSPVPLEVISGTLELAVGPNSSACVRLPDSEMRCWGRKRFAHRIGDTWLNVEWGPFAPPEAAGLTDVVAISVGHDQFFGRRSDGTIWGWGYDTGGSLGDGEVVSYGLTQVLYIDDAIAFGAHSRTNCAVRADGSVWCWGFAEEGEAGPPGGTGFRRHEPYRIEGIDNAVDVQPGGKHVCALSATGEVYCWGKDGYRGDGSRLSDDYHFTSSAAPVTGLPTVRKLRGGGGVTCAITESGELWCWGTYSVVPTPEYARPSRIEGIGPIVDVAIGEPPGTYEGRVKGAICVLEECGAVLCWGRNTHGEVGDGTYIPATEPTEVIGLP